MGENRFELFVQLVRLFLGDIDDGSIDLKGSYSSVVLPCTLNVLPKALHGTEWA